MTTPLHSRDLKSKGRWYGPCSDTCPLQGELLISVTNAQSVVNKPALPPSAAKITAAAAWDYLPQMVATSRQDEAGPNGCDKKRVADRCGRCRFCVTAQVKAHYQQEWESKMELGTRVHRYAEAHVMRQPMPPDEEVEPFIGEYLKWLRAWGVDLDEHIEAVETTIFDTKHGYAGTGDLWVWLPTGKDGDRQLWLVDLKTSLSKPANTVYVDQVLQLAGLRFAPKAVLVDDSVVDVPKFAGTALLNLRVNDHALIPLPADRAAHKAFLNAVGLRKYLLDQDTRSWEPLKVPVLPEPQLIPDRKAVAQ